MEDSNKNIQKHSANLRTTDERVAYHVEAMEEFQNEAISRKSTLLKKMKENSNEPKEYRKIIKELEKLFNWYQSNMQYHIDKIRESIPDTPNTESATALRKKHGDSLKNNLWKPKEKITKQNLEFIKASDMSEEQ